MSATAVHRGLPDTVLKAVIIYDDFNSATRATALLERVAFHADEAMKWDIKPWKFDVVKQPTLAALTVAVAANADLVVLALRRRQSIQAELQDWLKNWAERRRIEDAALLVLPSGETRTATEPPKELKAFAAEQGLTFLDRNNLGDDRSSTFFGHPRTRRLTAPEPARMFAGRLPLPPHWGINE